MFLKYFAIIAIAIIRFVFGDSLSFSLTKKTLPPGSQHMLPVRRHGRTGNSFEFYNGGFWFANFTVGAESNVDLLVDTGSSDVFVNQYKPSPLSVNINDDFNITFGTTNSNGSGTETLTGPIYKDIVALDGTGLTVSDQAIGVPLYVSTPGPAFPLDGLIGFAGPLSDVFNSTPWLHSLCNQGSLDECRFGLALETDGTGEQYLGKVEHDRLAGPLSVAPVFYYTSPEIDAYFEWATFGDLAFDGKVIARDRLIRFDSGTTVIIGSLDDVQAMFDSTGVQSVITPPATPEDLPLLTGYYPCNSPPDLGFGFPSITNATTAKQQHSEIISHSSTVYEMLPEALAFASTGNNCTASIFWSDEFGGWLIGQVFFQGRYIDHNVAEHTMGFANLR